MYTLQPPDYTGVTSLELEPSEYLSALRTGCRPALVCQQRSWSLPPVLSSILKDCWTFDAGKRPDTKALQEGLSRTGLLVGGQRSPRWKGQCRPRGIREQANVSPRNSIVMQPHRSLVDYSLDVMIRPGSEIYSVSAEETVLEAVNKLVQHGVW